MFLTAFLISLEVSAQNVRVSGVVTDALGPIPGANIMEEGTTNGTVTDVNGKYSISVSAKSTLVFSCIGYKEQKIRVGTKTVLNVNMVEESKMLDELVVVGYGVDPGRPELLVTFTPAARPRNISATFPAGNVFISSALTEATEEYMQLRREAKAHDKGIIDAREISIAEALEDEVMQRVWASGKFIDLEKEMFRNAIYHNHDEAAYILRESRNRNFSREIEYPDNHYS